MDEERTISVLDNLNTINYIIQECMKQSIGKPIVARNAYAIGDGFAMDIRIEGKADKYNFHIRTEYLYELCRISITPDKMLVRYNSKFMFLYKPKTQLYTTNLFDEPFTLEEMEAVFFTQNCVDGWGLQIDFDYDIMNKTLTMCRRLYDDFLISIKK